MQPKNIAVNLDTGGAVVPSQPTNLLFSLTDKPGGEPVSNLAIEHEQPMHLIIVRRDLDYFAHVHPRMDAGPGKFQVAHTFPTAGDYILYNEFAVEGFGHETHRFELQAGGAPSAGAELVPDLGPQRAGDHDVALKAPAEIRAGQDAAFVATVTHEGQPADLQPYLGAAAHVVVLDEGASNFAHVHGYALEEGSEPTAGGHAEEEAGHEEAPHGPQTSHFGPDIGFNYTFPRPGLYKVWAQFVGHDGLVNTVSWVVEAR